AIFDAATDWSNLVHRPTQAHRAVTTDTTIRRSQTGDSARRRWRHDRAKGFSADRETDQARGGRRCRTRRRTARAVSIFVRVLRIAVDTAEPFRALRQCAHRKFRDQNCSRITQTLDYRRVVIADLIPIKLGAPGRL